MELSEQQIDALRARAEAGEAEAQYEMGWRQAIGMGLALDDAAAVRWLRSAAGQGHSLAQNNLGARYLSGDGVARNLVEAWLWFSRAAEQGDRKAGKNRDSVAQNLSEAELLDARKRLTADAETAGESGSTAD